MRFTDRTAIVTGAASGIGLATAKLLAAQGARVAIVDIDAAQADGAVRQARDSGAPDAIACVCDVSRPDQVASAVARLMQRWGRFDVLVNNAGLMQFKALVDLEQADWMRILSVDLLGAFLFTKHAFLHMRPGGAIVNVSSIHAVETEPLIAPYAAAKAALLSLTRSSALEGKPRGLRINAILPGAVDTPMLWNNPNVRSGAEAIARDDVGAPEDVASAIAYLASDEARFVQGAALRVDGGRLDRL